jgi:hypothetical protein
VIDDVNSLPCVCWCAESKRKLRDHFVSTGQAPNALVIEMQRDMLEKIGVDKDFGVQCLNRIPHNFKHDPHVMIKLQHFVMW